MRILVAALMTLIILWSMTVVSVHAQEPTLEPTITPTPDYIIGVELTSGNELRIERSVTFGEIAVVIAVMVLVLVIIVGYFVQIPRMWYR